LLSDSATSIYIWGDNRIKGGIYAQRLDTLGSQLWDTSDVALNIPMFSEMYVTTNCAGGAISVGFHQFDFSIRALQVSRDGNLGEVLTNVKEGKKNILPLEYNLSQNYPNPFNPTTKIRFEIRDFGLVTLKVFDLLGQEVTTILNEVKPAGSYEVKWNAESVPSGVYFYRLVASPSTNSGHHYVETMKMLLLR
jgi:hypothetical protein